MIAGSRLEKKVKKNEGFSALPYRDTEGNLTVGHGINLDAGITEEESLLIVRHRLARIREAVAYNIPFFTRLSLARQDILVEMAYNMGVAKLLGFKDMLSALAVDDYENASLEMLDSKWSRQVKGRAVLMAKSMLKG